MYNAHFGFREKPFKLVPNPDYLYLSRNHEIALAHLTYAVNQGDGFVVITGEVGTGKTTLCRIFLERLDESIESAYIFNPKLDSTQLLTSICGEFGIHSNSSSLKQLLDDINGYLITKNQAGRNVVLLIDEAQNLGTENLEMVRMLSNLETTRNKLLQIILVGQPELGDKLDSYELRQLAQRISLSAHLTPLGFSETIGYIQHRINIAAQRQMNLFTRGACRKIYRFSGGIPRLINIACDRALLTAFSLNRSRVTTTVARIAVQELANRGRAPARRRFALWIAAAACILVAAGWVFTHPDSMKSLLHANSPATGAAAIQRPPADSAKEPPQAYKIDPLPATDTPVAVHAPASTAKDVPPDPEPAGPPKPHPADLSAVVNVLEHDASRLNAVGRVLGCWRQPPPNAAQLPANVADRDYFDIAARQYGLRVYAVHSNWGLIKQLNLPAILSLKKDAGSIVYMAMVGWQDGKIQLADPSGRGTLQTTLDALLQRMAGPVYLYWKNSLGLDGLIGAGSPAKQIRTVKNLLRCVGYNQIDSQPEFDQQTEQAILDFQSRNRLTPDGLVGPLTKIFLIKAADAVPYPRLNEKRSDV